MRISAILAAVLCFALTARTQTQPQSETVKVAAAADLSFALKDVAARFEKTSGNKVVLSFGSSGNFYSEISNGAPFDVFCSADVSYPQRLIDAKLAVSESLFVYARGSIVLWVRKDSTLDVKQGLAILLDPGVHKIAIANPQHAPYGKAAEAALRSEHLWEKVQERLILGENISQAAQFVSSGNADIGILALSLALSPGLKDAGHYQPIPQSDYPPLDQAAVILKNSAHQTAAQAFIDFLKQPEIQQLLHQYGFRTAREPEQLSLALPQLRATSLPSAAES